MPAPGLHAAQGVVTCRSALPLPSLHRPLASYYQYLDQERDYICSKPEDHGMHLCSDIPPLKIGDMECSLNALPFSHNEPFGNNCVNWNQYYSDCKSQGNNPFQGTISFDNIGLAWVAIFLVSPYFSQINMIYRGGGGDKMI